jgi:acyl-coenzyme A synthetase/AMP-(fatty) acid ligase
LKWSRQHLPDFSTPKRVMFVETLAKNSTGKVLKQELRKLLPK